MIKYFLSLLIIFCVTFLFGENKNLAISDSEIWNEGVSYYRDGDNTNALRVLRSLLLSKSHGPRAAEVISKLSYDIAHTPGETNHLVRLEESANAAQIALRSNPKDARLNRNFTRAIESLPELRETSRINDILSASKGKDPSAILKSAVYDARDLMKEAISFRTNQADIVISKSDSLSMRAQKLADCWYPVREVICQAVTNEEQAATIASQIDGALKKTKEASILLADLKDDAYSFLADSEIDFTRFLKLTIPPPEAMREDMISQSNALTKVEIVNNRQWQNDALDYTRSFRDKFPAWARAYELEAQADTNKPPFTAEAQAKISDLSTQLEKLQLANIEREHEEHHKECIRLIDEILKLLPNQNSSQNNKQQQQQNNQNNESNKNEQNKNQNGNNDSENNNDQNSQQENQNDEKEESVEEKESSKEDREVDSILRKAQERSDEHEAEKRARMRKAPLPPNARDW